MEAKLLWSLLTVGLVSYIMGMGTIAYFSDTETSEGNTMAAGILNLIVGGNDPWPADVPFVNIADLKPSYTRVNSTDLMIQNNPGKLYKRISGIACDQGVSSEPEVLEENGQPKYDIDKYTWFDLGVKGQTYIPDNALTIADIADKYIYLGCFQPGVTIPVTQSFHLWTNVTNWAQGDNCRFVEEYLLQQTNDTTIPSPCFNDCHACLTGKGLKVLSYLQGKRWDGTAVRAQRSVPNQALWYEAAAFESSFFSLGFGNTTTGAGWMILEFTYPVVDDSGNDVKVIEDTWGGPYPIEKADISVSQDGINWTFLGVADNSNFVGIHTITEFDLATTGLSWAKYFKVVDTTDKGGFDCYVKGGCGGYSAHGSDTVDGFDLNAIVAVQDCQEPIC